MANPKHIKKLLEGVEAWNAWRAKNPFTKPDLSEEDIWKVFNNDGKLEQIGDWFYIPLSGVNFSNANLKGAKLRMAYLVDANLRDANLKKAELVGADLTGAVLSYAKLQKANFKNAKLANAKFDFSKLHQANFDYAYLNNTYLFRSEVDTETDFSLVESFSNVDLVGARPWEAILYSKKDRNLSPNSFKHKLKKIKSTVGLLKRIRQLQDHHQGDNSVLYFRGETKCGLELQPSVMRNSNFRKHEGEMLRELITRRPEEFNTLGSALEEWVLTQHYKMPTRFLDVTRNPLVALFNACMDDKFREEKGSVHIFAVPKKLIKSFNSDAISIITNLAKLTHREQRLILGFEAYKRIPGDEKDGYDLAKLRLYQGIRQEKPYFDERIDIRDLYKVFVVEPQRFPERIRAQSGAFLASAFHDKFEPEEIRHWNERIPVYSHYKLTIPSDCKEDIIDELRLLNITEETLFPGLDSAAAAVKAMYMPANKKTGEIEDTG